MQAYVDAGTCDWAHWSEMWEACETYDYPELEDGFFIAEVQAGRCTAANWPTLRAQLVASSPSVLVRAHCNATAEVIPGTELDGCVTLAGTGASYVSVAPEETVTLYAGAGCTGEALTVQADANLCQTSYASGAATNDNVRSFRIEEAQQRPSAARYTCAPEETTCVESFNGGLASVNSTHTVKIVRVTQAGRTTASIADIKTDLRQLYDFYDIASRNQVGLRLLDGSHQTVNVPGTFKCGKVRLRARKASTNSGAFVTVFMLPHGVCNFSDAGSRHIFLEDTLQRTYAHEIGHVLGLAHGERAEDDGSDPTTYMGKMPSDNYNLPQLHWLGWTNKEELVQVNSAIEDGSAFDVTIRPVDRNADNGSGLPLGAVWEIPTTGNRVFMAVPKSRTTDLNQVDGGGVYVYRAPRCEGCTGMSMWTIREARFGPKSNSGHIVMDIVISPVAYKSRKITVEGKEVEVFDSVTLRIRQAAPVVLTPAADTVASSNRPTFSGTAQAGLKVNLFVDGVGMATPTATAEGTWSFTPAAALAPGAHTVHTTATDVEGKISPKSSTHTFTIP
ncbi:Ig-like domain-containing protein [Pyxidicoccus caerfyrddinensis]|uniref:Ig-like domain-containing protein n=1 Tax=Pyxidicoccus caerfyrddinensis TaxID=2709663 RepID=UPI00196840AE|nr:Ig-like domain-containing protein [Pyxidicoccus caerfyrddinensis]